MELLTTVSKRLGIETYLEESQFGLLKTTLAIAGKRFVLDVELEADSTTGGYGDGDGEEMETETPAPTPGGQQQQQRSGGSTNGDGVEQRGKVRLAKLMVNHVTKDGGTANSTSIAHAIRQSIEVYLGYWNSEDRSIAERDEEEVEETIRRLWQDMSDLAALDALSESSGKDWFGDLEERAKMVERLIKRLVSPSFGHRNHG